jgi:uncharacterized membrane protein YedE/YeeE
MKKVNTIYWIFTGLLILLMAFSAIGSFLPPKPEAVAMMAKLGYPAYVIKMLAVAKILGIIALLVPGFPKIKEWAYAGFTFDLLGAIVSFIITGFPVMAWAPMLIFIAFIALSYIYWHKKLQLQGLES